MLRLLCTCDVNICTVFIVKSQYIIKFQSQLLNSNDNHMRAIALMKKTMNKERGKRAKDAHSTHVRSMYRIYTTSLYVPR